MTDYSHAIEHLLGIIDCDMQDRHCDGYGMRNDGTVGPIPRSDARDRIRSYVAAVRSLRAESAKGRR
jgi:hypothetical protein